MKRKDFITAAALTAAAAWAKTYAAGTDDHVDAPAPGPPMQTCIFSKQLQWLNYSDMAAAVAQLGYNGIDLTVRDNGHVLPQNVERDLPKAVEAAEKAGVKILMISTDIKSAEDPLARRVLKMADALHIRYYRTAGLNYPKNTDLQSHLQTIKQLFAGIEEFNKQHKLYSSYLNHSGEGFGSCIWDLWLSLKDLDPAFIGSQFDIKHATIAGAYSWPVSLQLIHPYVKTMVVRDFRWETVNNSWQVTPVPIGEGMVDMKRYSALVKSYNLQGPVCIMCDYDLGGAENGNKQLTIPGEKVLQAMKKDLDTLKAYWKAAGINI